MTNALEIRSMSRLSCNLGAGKISCAEQSTKDEVMIRDPLKAHAILNAVQAYSTGEPVDLFHLKSKYSREETFGAMTPEEFKYHLELLVGGGFLRAESPTQYQLTWDGHDLLEVLDEEFDEASE